MVCLLLAFSAAEAQTPPPAGRARLQRLLDDAYAVYTADFGRADSLFSAAAAEARQNDWVPEEAAALKYLGIVKYLSGHYPEALEDYQRSLSLYEGLNDAAGRAAVLMELGNFFKKRNEIDRALDHLRRGERLSREAGDSVLLSNSLDTQGRIFQSTGDRQRAADLFARVLAIRRAIRDTVGLTYVYDNLGSLATEQGNFPAALAYLDSSIVIRRQLHDRQGEAIAVNNQGEVLLASGDTAAAVPYLQRSLAISRAVGFTDLQQWTMGLLSESYAAVGDFATALAVQRGVQLLKDSLYSESTSRQVAEMQEQYEAEKRQRLLESREASLAQRNAWLVAAGLGVILLLCLLGYVVRHAARRRGELRRQAELRLRDDRLRISRDLHDHLGAELGIIASDLGRLGGQRGDDRLGAITGQVRYAMEQMRETIWAVRLEQATWEDLFARLRSFSARLTEGTVAFTLDPALTGNALEPHRVLQLYRFGQEALRNAVRHAGGTRIEVVGRPGAFEISDNGCGFDPAAVTAGYGLSSLRERAAELGGELIVEDLSGGGTLVGLHWGNKYANPRIDHRRETADL